MAEWCVHVRQYLEIQVWGQCAIPLHFKFWEIKIGALKNFVLDTSLRVRLSHHALQWFKLQDLLGASIFFFPKVSDCCSPIVVHV